MQRSAGRLNEQLIISKQKKRQRKSWRDVDYAESGLSYQPHPAP
ncbi:hypothetical protein EC2845350_3393 [Escherichia coli 2845350]|nr:hypothetical protein EC2845350_3393 [Escherichia coli 2845350]